MEERLSPAEYAMRARESLNGFDIDPAAYDLETARAIIDAWNGYISSTERRDREEISRNRGLLKLLSIDPAAYDIETAKVIINTWNVYISNVEKMNRG